MQKNIINHLIEKTIRFKIVKGKDKVKLGLNANKI